MDRQKLAQRLSSGRTFWMAGAYDALSARIIEQAGFDGVFTTGFGITASYLGQPDMELLSLAENIDVVRRIVDAVDVPVFADADTGYGNVLNVRRTVMDFERAGASGLVLEDQVSPKRCPAVSNTVLVAPVQESVAKLKAALDARLDPNFLIIARTDAVDPSEALDRTALYAQTGADLVQPISRTFNSLDGLKELKKRSSKPVSLQLIEGTWLSTLDREQVESVAMFATYPLLSIMTVSHALTQNMAALLEGGFRSCPSGRTDLAAFKKLVRFDQLQQLQHRYETD